jgi:hypothetical protein
MNMSAIELPPPVEEWFERYVFSAFTQQEIIVTPSAKFLMVYAFLSQQSEGTQRIRRACDQVASRIEANQGPAGTFVASAVDVYLQLYPTSAVLNVNRAIRLLHQMYALTFGEFPCGPTRGEDERGGGSEGSGSQGGSGSRTQFFQNTPATSQG